MKARWRDQGDWLDLGHCYDAESCAREFCSRQWDSSHMLEGGRIRDVEVAGDDGTVAVLEMVADWNPSFWARRAKP